MAAVGFTSGDPRKVNRTGDTMSGDLALLGAADLSVEDDATVGDDVTIGGTLTVVGPAEIGGKNGLASLSFGGLLGAAGPPVAGDWSTGDLVVDTAGAWWLCTAGGTPGTWVVAVVVGTTPGTVAAGDDIRIVGAIQSALVDAAGDLLVGSAPDTVIRKPVGADGQVLTAQAAQLGGLLWAALTAGDVGADPAGTAASEVGALAAALAISLPATYLALAGGTVVGDLVVDDANLSILGTDKGYRFRPLGSRLDCEATGSDWQFSVFSGTNFDGVQRNYMRLEAGVQLAHAIGRWIWATSPDSGAVHTIDPTDGIGFYGAGPQPQGTVTGSRGGNVALANLLTQLATHGLIVDSTTP